MLKLTPAVFWNLSPQELHCMSEGHLYHQKEQWHMLAWQTAHIMNSSGNYKKKISIKDLIGDDIVHRDIPAMTKDERNTELKKIANEINESVNY